MNRSAAWISFMGFLFPFVCVAIIGYGLYIVSHGLPVIIHVTQTQQNDSTFTYQKMQTDTTGSKKNTVKADTLIVRKIAFAPQADPCSSNCSDNLMKRGYDLVFLGIMLLLIFYALPFLSEFSFLQLFSAKFRAANDSLKAASNENTNMANIAISAQNPPTIEKPVDQKRQEIINSIFPEENTNVEAMAAYLDDPQKGKWGKLAYRNERRITAAVTSLGRSKEGKPLFKVVIKVISTNILNPLTGSVQFHLHPTFAVPDPVIFVLNGEAVLELTAWGAFTVGAEADKGATPLELDLEALPEAPVLFKAN